MEFPRAPQAVINSLGPIRLWYGAKMIGDVSYMDQRTILLGMLLSGFFAVACIRAGAPTGPADRFHFRNLLRLPGRWERLQHTRWQWFSMVGLMLVLRLQNALPPILEGMATLQFVLFLALPSRPGVPVKSQGRGNEAPVGSR